MIRSRILRLVYIFFILIFVLGCNLTETIGGQKAAVEPTAPVVVYVTATPQPTLPPPTPTPTATPTPEAARLVVTPCADYPDDCPAAVNSRDFYDPAPPFEYTFDIPSTTQLFVSTGWGAIDMATLQQNIPYVDFFLEIDGEDYYSDLYTSILEEPDVDNPAKMNGIIYLDVVISGWVPQQPHTITIGYTTTAPLNDGWEDYETGFEVKRVLHVCPDGGCPGTTSSNTGTLSYTPCLQAENCPNVANVFEYIDFHVFEAGKEYTVAVPYDQPLLLQTGFFMENPVYVEASRPKLDFFFEVDGVDQMQESFVGLSTMQNFMDPSVTLTGYTLGVVIDGWVKNKPHHVRFGYKSNAEIFDGTYTRPAGDTNELLLLINPVE